MTIEPDKIEEPAPPKTPSRLARLQETKLPLWVSAVLLLVLLIVFTWGRITSGAAERRLEAERRELMQKVEAERATLQRETQESLGRETRELQLLFGHALAYAVRSAVLRNNFDEVDQYFSDLVRNPRVTLVLFADTEGKILRASDRKYVDTRFGEHFPADLLKSPDVSVHPGEGARRQLVAPIQGLTARVGTVLLVYAPPA
jgi:hypothetical protein